MVRFQRIIEYIFRSRGRNDVNFEEYFASNKSFEPTPVAEDED
jgi:hypothetical protein